MEHVVARMRTALALSRAAHAVGAEAPHVRAGGNPVELLTRPPWNYVGRFRDVHASEVPEGRWFFDESRGVLVYRVKHADAFRGGAVGVARARFRVAGAHDGDGKGDAKRSGVGSRRVLTLRVVEPYRWLGPHDEEDERKEG